MQDTKIEPQGWEHVQAGAVANWAMLAFNAAELIA